MGLLVVDAGHFGTEEIVADGIRDYLLDQSARCHWDVIVQSFEKQIDFFFEWGVYEVKKNWVFIAV